MAVATEKIRVGGAWKNKGAGWKGKISKDVLFEAVATFDEPAFLIFDNSNDKRSENSPDLSIYVVEGKRQQSAEGLDDAIPF